MQRTTFQSARAAASARSLAFYLLAGFVFAGAAAWAQDDAGAEDAHQGVAELRHAHGVWDVTTEMIAPDGSVQRTLQGIYSFEWVMEDKILIGRTEQPDLGRASGILFYYRESTDELEQVAVGPDGHLWVMTGPADGNVRTTPPTPRSDGSTIQLRFTHYNFEPDRFESKMEVTRDGGETWFQANHQVLTRRSEPREAEPERLSWDNLEERLDAEAEAGFTGAVLVVRDGEVVLDKGYGLANRETGAAITPNTIFATGSLPIDYTHAAILWLGQEGEIELSDPITDYFDKVPADKRAITVEHLMTGASGLPDFHGRPEDRDPDHSWIDREEAVRRILEHELLFPPGEGDEHSHSAWGLLAAIVEIASGKSYQEFTRERIFEPAGMASTGFNGDPVPTERLAIGYGRRSDGEVNAPPYWGPTSWLVLGSGGQVGTTRDTGRFLDALREGKILEPEWAERFLGPGVGASRNGDAYGYEMFVYHSPGAASYAVTLTNANKPAMGAEDDTHFIRLSREIGNFLLKPYLPKYRLGLGFDRAADGTLLVGSLSPDGAAKRDGLVEGDVLVSAGGVELGDDPMAVLEPYLQSGDAIELIVRRDGKRLALTIRPDPR